MRCELLPTLPLARKPRVHTKHRSKSDKLITLYRLHTGWTRNSRSPVTQDKKSSHLREVSRDRIQWACDLVPSISVYQNTSLQTSLAAMFQLRNQWDLTSSLSLSTSNDFSRLLSMTRSPLSNILIDVSILRNGLPNSSMKHPAARPCNHRYQAVSLVTASQHDLP
jgi:hypothetical protein